MKLVHQVRIEGRKYSSKDKILDKLLFTSHFHQGRNLQGSGRNVLLLILEQRNVMYQEVWHLGQE